MPPRKRAVTEAETTEKPQILEAEQPENEVPNEPDADGGPELGDLQAAEQPCPECVPNGWPDGAFSVGCVHGTWTRDSA